MIIISIFIALMTFYGNCKCTFIYSVNFQIIRDYFRYCFNIVIIYGEWSTSLASWYIRLNLRDYIHAMIITYQKQKINKSYRYVANSTILQYVYLYYFRSFPLCFCSVCTYCYIRFWNKWLLSAIVNGDIEIQVYKTVYLRDFINFINCRIVEILKYVFTVDCLLLLYGILFLDKNFERL